jgi:8-oxo-dGTP pyrophosphatase MutT (NUDIX family)
MALDVWSEVSRRVMYAGRIFSVVQARRRSAAQAREFSFDILECPDWVNVVALTGEGRVVVIRQYRAGTQAITLEVPGGTVDEDETPLDAARRELSEETGYQADTWELIGRVEPNPAFQTNSTYTYLARNARRTGPQRLDDTELIDVEERAVHDIPQLISDGTIAHALVVCAFFHLASHGLLEMSP